MAIRRDDLHQLIDDLPENDIPLIRALLTRFRPIHVEIAEDDEAWTEDDEIAFQEGLRDIQQGAVISADDAKNRLLG